MNLPHFTGAPAQVGAQRRAEWGAAWERLAPPLRFGAPRAVRLREILATVAPHWLEEAAAFAPGEEALASYLHFQCREPQPDADSLADANCSTLLALGSAAVGGQPLLLKIRDEAPLPQVAFRQQSPGCYAYLGGTNIGNLGLAHVANEKGLVGGNNTGGPLKDRSTEVGLNDCLILRLIAERCATCGEAIGLLEELANGGFLGNGGYARGMIFLLADATGEGAIAECTRSEVFAQRWREGVYWRTNHFVFPELEPHGDPARAHEGAVQSSHERYVRMGHLSTGVQDVGALQRLSRDEAGTYPLCQAGGPFPWRTVSAWVHSLESRTVWVCNGAPSQAVYDATPFC